MAIIQSNVAAKQTTIALNSKLGTTEFGGRVREIHGTVTTTNGAAGTVIELARLPKGARLLPQSMIHFEAGQNASLTVKVGDALDDDRYFSGTPGASATSKNLSANVLNDYVCPEETMLIATTGAQALTANKKITFDLFYVVD